ncbi:hypothetical protein F5X99DRAFT_387054 [Biscogniauxia marginata]|nr:hypothetical protein F5X99DRAFT_387054 [Biscogniauxia marginata]
MMKCLVIALSLTSLAFASSPAPAGPWTAYARNRPDNGEKLIFGPIEANGGGFWIGKNVSTYCPSDTPDIDCSAYSGTETVFTGGNNTVFLNVAVPGGQQVYISPTGALAYTPPHSAPPEGSTTSGFWRVRSEGSMGAVFLGHNDASAFACPTEEEDVYRVFFGRGVEDCLSFMVYTSQYSGVNSWEYL